MKIYKIYRFSISSNCSVRILKTGRALLSLSRNLSVTFRCRRMACHVDNGHCHCNGHSTWKMSSQTVLPFDLYHSRCHLSSTGHDNMKTNPGGIVNVTHSGSARLTQKNASVAHIVRRSDLLLPSCVGRCLGHTLRLPDGSELLSFSS